MQCAMQRRVRVPAMFLRWFILFTIKYVEASVAQVLRKSLLYKPA